MISRCNFEGLCCEFYILKGNSSRWLQGWSKNLRIFLCPVGSRRGRQCRGSLAYFRTCLGGVAVKSSRRDADASKGRRRSGREFSTVSLCLRGELTVQAMFELEVSGDFETIKPAGKGFWVKLPKIRLVQIRQKADRKVKATVMEIEKVIDNLPAPEFCKVVV